MQGPRVRQLRPRPSTSIIGVVIFALCGLLLGSCGAPAEGTRVVALVEPTATATALPPTATPLSPTATATPLPPPPTIAPLATTTPRPTTTPVVAPTVARPTTVAGGYRADWSAWESGEDDKQQLRYSFDRPKDEYHVTVLKDDNEWSIYAPEEQRFQNFTLEVEARPINGPDTLGYGLTFRRQVRAADKSASERYIFYVTPQGRFTLFQINADNVQRVVRTLDAPGQPGVIKVGQASNRLKVVCQGATITLSINELEVFRLNNATITQPGEIGIFVASPLGAANVEVAFRNLQLRPNP